MHSSSTDISIWLHQVVKGFQDSNGATLPHAHLLGLFHRLCKLMYYRIKPVFVFDGGVPPLKRETIVSYDIQQLVFIFRQIWKFPQNHHQVKQNPLTDTGFSHRQNVYETRINTRMRQTSYRSWYWRHWQRRKWWSKPWDRRHLLCWQTYRREKPSREAKMMRMICSNCRQCKRT